MALRKLAAVAATAITALALTAGTATAQATTAQATNAQAPKLDHVFLIMEENNGFSDVIGNKAAPNLNYLASTFGLETGYYGLSGDSSETNYVGLLGGSTYNVTSDDAYWKNAIQAPSLISQLDRAHIGWKAYLQSSPHVGYQGICYPARCNGAPDSDPLYVSKHDAIQNFTTSWNRYDWSRQVPMTELQTDLANGDVPRFSYVIPDECHDMHGDPPFCLDSGNIGDPQNQHLVSVGDAYLGQLVSEITHAKFWARGNNAIVVTYDNGDDTKGCCDANPGGGRVATVVITSHGPRHATDNAPANHYSLLATLQDNFGLGCLKFTCDTANVKPLTALVAVTGSKAIATTARTELTWPTPTPSQPAEAIGETPSTASANGWTVQKAQTLGASDNSLGAIAGSSGKDIWAVGNYLPDTSSSNQDATLSFAEHYDGRTWTVVRTPNAGPNFGTLFGVADSRGQAWAVGTHLNSAYQNRALVEHWDGKKWTIGSPVGGRAILYAVAALAPDNVWAVGDQEGRDGVFTALAEHFDGTKWTAIPTPDPGDAGDHLYGLDAVSGNDIWAVGQRLSASGDPDQGLVEHWNGTKWSVVSVPTAANVMLTGVTVSNGQVIAVGESDSPSGGRALILRDWRPVRLPAIPSDWVNLWSVTSANGTAYATGSYVNPATDTNELLVLAGSGGAWRIAGAPQPGSGSDIGGGIAAVVGHEWIAGTYNDGGSRLPLVEVHLYTKRWWAPAPATVASYGD